MCIIGIASLINKHKKFSICKEQAKEARRRHAGKKMEIGSKIKRLRAQQGLTLEELASRCELTKGFLSQLERDLTSPSIATLADILEALGSSLSEFFSDTPEEQQRQRRAWQTVQRGHAVANGLPVVAVNRVGYEPDPSGRTKGIQFWGTSFVAGPQGEILYEASSTEEESIIVELDLTHSEQVRRWWPFLRDRRIEEYGGITKRFLD